MNIKNINSISNRTCIELDGNLRDVLDYILSLNVRDIIFKVRIDDIKDIKDNLDILEYNNLPIIYDYFISNSHTNLEYDLSYLTNIDSINNVTLTKEVIEGEYNTSYHMAEYIYYLDRFNLKTSFVGDDNLIELWESYITKYYNNSPIITKKRELKVVK
jgi:hypothetical protein